jgi:5-methylcytosine-specific restriction enzyme A
MRLHGTERWRRMAKYQLRVEPLCAMCLAEGRGPVPARVADHIEPHHGDVNKFWLGKLQSLCSNCHECKKKFREKNGYDKGCDIDGWPLDPNHPVYTGVVK